MANQRQSYFAEKRESNPAYFNRVTLDEIRKNVRRIIRDVKNGNITDQDMVYFTNSQVIQACLSEAWDSYIKASVTANAFNFYIHEGINKGVRLFPSIDLNQERMHAAAEQSVNNSRANIWLQLFNMFTDIRNGVPAQAALQYVSLLSSHDMAIL